MNANIVEHSYGTFTIKQADGEIDVNGTLVPHGYVNVSNMCRVNGSKFGNYLNNKDTLSYFKALRKSESLTGNSSIFLDSFSISTLSDAKEYGVLSGLLIETKDIIGGIGDTYAHSEIGLDVARWISPEFRVWCNKTVLLVMRGEFIAATPAAKQAQEKVKQLGWMVESNITKTSNKDYNTSCKIRWKQKGLTMEETNKKQAIMTNELYVHLFGSNKKQLLKDRGLDENDNLRLHMSEGELRLIWKHESLTMSLLHLYRESTPEECLEYAKKVWDESYHTRISFSTEQDFDNYIY